VQQVGVKAQISQGIYVLVFRRKSPTFKQCTTLVIFMIQTTKALRQDKQCTSWTFNCVSAKNNSKALSWHQPTALFCTVHG